MTPLVRTLEVPWPAGGPGRGRSGGPGRAHGRLAARFRGVRHSTESFIASVYVGPVDPNDEDALARREPAGTIAMYGHGTVYGDQAALDDALPAFDVDVDLTGALGTTRPVDGRLLLTIVVRDLDDRLRPAGWLRFDEVTVSAFP